MLSKMTKAELIDELQRAQSQIAELEKVERQADCSVVTDTPASGTPTPVASLNDGRFRMFVEHSHDGFVMFDENGIIDIWNRAQAEITGIPEHRALGKPYWEIQLAMLTPESQAKATHSQMKARLQAAFADATRSALFVPREVEIISLDGVRKSLMITAFPIETAQGNRVGSIVRDITANKRALEAQRQSERRFATTFHASPVAQIITEAATGRILDANRAFCLQTGYACEELVGHMTAELGLWVDPQQMRAMRDQLRAGNSVRDLEGEFRTRNGAIHTVLSSFEPIVLNDVNCIIASSLDITSRKKTEAALRQSEEHYRTLVDTLNVSVCRWQPDTTLTFTNDQYRQIFGITGDGAGQKWLEFLPDAVRNETALYYRKLVDAPETVTYEHPVSLDDGRIRFYHWIDTPILDTTGKPVEFQSIGIDITERKRAEELVQAQRDLALIIGSIGSEVEAWPRCMDIVLRVTGMDSGGIYLFDDSGSSLDLVYHYGLGETFVQNVSHYGPETQNVQIILEGQSTYFETSGSDRYSLPIAEGIRAIATIPMKYQGRVLGALNVASHTLSAVPEHVRQVLETIADEIGNIAVYLRTANALRQSEDKYHSLVESQESVIATVDANGIFHFINEIGSALLAQPPESIIGQSIVDCLGADHANWLLRRVRAVLTGGQGVVDEYDLTIDGLAFCYRVSIQPVRNSDGPAHLALVNALDITERQRAINALAESERRLSSLVDAAMDAIVTVDSKFRILLFNPAAEQMFGIPVEQARSMTLEALMPERYRQEHYELMAALTQESAELLPPGMVIPIVGLRADGEEFPAETTISFVKLGNETLYTAILRDVSERRRAENALRASERRYRELMESLDSAVAALDPDGRYLYLNHVAASHLGGQAEGLIGKTIHDLYPEPYASQQLAGVRTVVNEDTTLSVEAFGAVLGEKRWFRTTVQPIHDETGKVAQVLVNSTDIHSIKMAQQQLQDLNAILEERVRQRTAELQDLYDNAPAGYHSVDGDGRVLMMNQTELRWLGYESGDVIGHLASEFLTPSSRAIFCDYFPLLKQRGWVKDLEMEAVRKDGTILPVLVNSTAVHDDHGNFVMSRSTVFDNTERKQIDEALRRANLEMERALRMKDEFLANMSHELRTPLNGILTLSEILLAQIQGPLNERQLKSLGNVYASGEHLLALINDLLDLSKIEAGKQELSPEEIVTDEVCQASLAMVRDMALAKHIRIEYTCNDALSRIYADPKRLKQMLINLLSNAVKFTPEGGDVRLCVEIDPARAEARFAVQDSGIGIAADNLSRLFQPFVQLDAGLARQYEGTGLGLALVKRLAVLHGGDVTVTSPGVPGMGSCFTITLPYAPPDPETLP